MYSPTSRYWMFLLGLRSDLTTLCACSTRCWRNISVATVITKAALLLQLLISSSWEMIFLTRATANLLDGVASLYRRIEQDVRGRDTVPVISLEGAMGVLLYGMAAVVESVDGMCEERGEVAGRDMRVEKWD
jgi:hypothetical protein